MSQKRLMMAQLQDKYEKDNGGTRKLKEIEEKLMENQYFNCKFREHQKTNDIFVSKPNPDKMEGEDALAQFTYKKKKYKLNMEYDKCKVILGLKACRPSILL